MRDALYVLMLLGALGAFDTLYYHEWRLRLPETATARRELRLHASRDLAYTIVFGSLAWTTWNGWLAWALAAVLAFEIVVTLKDFLEEDRTRKLPAGERVMHAMMGIVYGVFLTLLWHVSHAALSARGSAAGVGVRIRAGGLRDGVLDTDGVRGGSVFIGIARLDREQAVAYGGDSTISLPRAGTLGAEEGRLESRPGNPEDCSTGGING